MARLLKGNATVTSSQVVDLTVADDLTVTDSLTVSGNIIMADDTSIGIADDAERIEFDSAGDINILDANLGIGTSIPQTMQHNHTTTAFSTAWNNWGGDNIFLSCVPGAGQDNIGGNITFASPASPDNRVCAIASIQTGTDQDNNGIIFYVHPSSSYTGAITEAFKIAHDGVVTGTHGSYHTSSDERMKTNVVTIPDALSKVCSLRGVNFNWKPEFEPADSTASSDIPAGEKLNAGFIAQEVETIIPEVINTQKPYQDTGVDENGVQMNDGVDEKKSITDGNQLSAYLVEAIKELVTRIEALESA